VKPDHNKQQITLSVIKQHITLTVIILSICDNTKITAIIATKTTTTIIATTTETTTTTTPPPTTTTTTTTQRCSHFGSHEITVLSKHVTYWKIDFQRNL
jgi:hypothetical protein